MQKTIDVLNKQLANWNILYTKLHNYHWYVSGPHFFTLHAQFEALYNQAALHIDELAERILTIGGKPYATLKEYLTQASIAEATGQESAEQMVQTLAADFGLMASELKEGISVAEEAGDEITGDMLLAIQTELEKQVWMFEAFLGKK